MISREGFGNWRSEKMSSQVYWDCDSERYVLYENPDKSDTEAIVNNSRNLAER